MKYCQNCGVQLNDDQQVCLNCGILTNQLAASPTQTVDDNGSIGWGFLGFFIPVAGLILYLIWKNDAPKNARMAGRGALINAILAVLLIIIYFASLFILLLTFPAPR